MSFMQREIRFDKWYEIDGENGTLWIPADHVGDFTRDELDKMEKEQEFPPFKDFYNGPIWAVELMEGWGARLSAPGYLDCTEWSVFETEQEAMEWLDEMYPEEEETPEGDLQ